MKVRLRVYRVTQIDGRPWEQAAGDVIEVSDEEGARMIERQQAEAVDEPKRARGRPRKSEPEQAVDS